MGHRREDKTERGCSWALAPTSEMALSSFSPRLPSHRIARIVINPRCANLPIHRCGQGSLAGRPCTARGWTVVAAHT
eukprot:521376-Rhodomonas_salina.1